MSETTDNVRPMSDAEMDQAFGEATEATQAATDAPVTDAQPEEPQRERMVPHGALHEERERRKALEAEARQLREEKARFEERARMLLELRQPQTQPAEEQAPPSIDTDARGYVEWLGKQTQEVQRALAAQRQQAEQATQTQRLMGWAQQQEAAYIQQTPDYNQAATFLRENRAAELRELGVPEAEIMQVIQQDLMRIAFHANQQGTNPAARIYAVAKARGYKAAPAEPAATEVAETVTRGQQLASVPSGGRDAGAGGQMTPERLLRMSDAEFNAWYSKASDAQKRQVMGS